MKHLHQFHITEKYYSNTTVNQLIHKEYGGVVPEIASREHLELISKVVGLRNY